MKSKKNDEMEFDADIKELMNLIVNSFYSNDEIFIRELLSNACDALEKYRINKMVEGIQDDTILKVRVWIDEKEGTLNIEDTGIGMTKSDLMTNIGKVARSGTKEFLKTINKTKDISQIGQFGVGFYSSFLVSDKVTIITKNDNDDEYTWELVTDKSYKIKKNRKKILKRGTKIILKIKENSSEYLDNSIVKEIIKKYTQFINYPIEYHEQIMEYEGEKIKKLVKKEKIWNILNNIKPIWSRNPSEITEDEYNEFYKSTTKDDKDPLAYKHIHMEGNIQFDCIIYIPDNPPTDIFEQKTDITNLKLYVNRVFITDNCPDLIPEWLKFIKGVVDSGDIKLNVSREIVQHKYAIRQISKMIVKKCLELFEEIKSDEKIYNRFLSYYSKMLKFGVYEDSRNREKIVKYLKYYTAKSQDKMLTLDEYISKMDENQQVIYYITGITKESLLLSPFIENIVDNEADVLFFTDSIDEYMMQNLSDYDGKRMVDVSKDYEDFNEEHCSDEYKNLVGFIMETLDEKVLDVRISNRLNNSPCVLVTDENGWSGNMERIIKAQAIRDDKSDNDITSKIFEINADHNIMKTINERISDKSQINNCRNVINLLYETALINSGFYLEKPSYYASKVNYMVELGFCN